MENKTDDATLEDLIFECLRQARAFVAAFKGAAFAVKARDGAFISRCLSSIEEGHILDNAAEGAINATRNMLCREVSKETFDTRRVFDGYHDPEFGDVGRAVQIPLRTVRGDDLAELLAQLDGLAEARNVALDRLRAEKEVRKRI